MLSSIIVLISLLQIKNIKPWYTMKDWKKNPQEILIWKSCVA